MRVVQRRLRVLCLHGYTMNGASFARKLAPLQAATKDIADFEYVDGFYEAETASERDKKASERGRAWWNAETDVSGKGVYVGAMESIDKIKAMIRDKGPVDGVFGFSQGACLAGALCAGLERDAKAPNLRFAIMVGGFVPRDAKLRELYPRDGAGLRVASLHVSGAKDAMVPPAASKALETRFAGAKVYLHQRGHSVPAKDPAFQDLLKEFLEVQWAAQSTRST